MVNFVVMYEKDGWSVCLVYNWCLCYLLIICDVIFKVLLFYNDIGQFDGLIFYNWNENVMVGIQGINLINLQFEIIMVLNNEGFEIGCLWFKLDCWVVFVMCVNFQFVLLL